MGALAMAASCLTSRTVGIHPAATASGAAGTRAVPLDSRSGPSANSPSMLGSFKVIRHRTGNKRVILDLSNSRVAPFAQQPTELSRLMIVVDGQSLKDALLLDSFRTTANCAQPFARNQCSLKLINRQTIAFDVICRSLPVILLRVLAFQLRPMTPLVDTPLFRVLQSHLRFHPLQSRRESRPRWLQ